MEWKTIPEFPDYEVSDTGKVRNKDSERILALTRNQHGVILVGLMKDNRQYKRGVAHLVADAFLDPPALEAFDTVINLDGDRSNNHVENLMWRPRWFAIRYHQQFKSKLPMAFSQRVQEIQTGLVFKNSWEAATIFGLLDREILVATMNNTYVWPTYQRFKVLED